MKAQKKLADQITGTDEMTAELAKQVPPGRLGLSAVV